MNKDEKLVEEFLYHLGYATVVYEPDGNTPPDFLVGNKIAIEVRRLNQNFTFQNGKTKGLETLWIPLWQKFEKLLISYGPPVNNKSWFIGMDFQRPLEPWATLSPKIRKVLEYCKNEEPNKLLTLNISDQFEIDLIPASKSHKTMFLMGASSDGDSGGLVLNEIEKNLKFVLSEKTRKIEKFKSKYSGWWLVLPDYIGYSLDEIDRKQFRELITIEHSWDKVVLIDPRSHTNWFAI